MIHHPAMDGDSNSSLRHPSGPPPSRPPSRSSRPAPRTRVIKPPGATNPTSLGVLTENTVNTPLDIFESTSPIKEGLGSLNRWSHSTVSSKSPSEHQGHHRRGSSKMSLAGYSHPAETHSPQKAPASNGLAALDLPELETSTVFNTDQTSNQLDLSFTASSSLSQPPTHMNIEVGSQDHLGTRTPGGSTKVSEGQRDPENRQRGQTQKVMLSKALQKANTAVLLDNAANFEGAMKAYTDACNLLRLVMVRSNGGDEEKIKLQEIHDTYMIRVTELHRMDFGPQESDDKALPDRPLSQESFGELLHLANKEPHSRSQQISAHSSLDSHHNPPVEEKELALEPDPLRRRSVNIEARANRQDVSNVSTSWLDTIDESGASSPSSGNSNASSVYLRRRTSHRLSNDTEAEFDAALDAAVEAAYDEGLEPVLEHQEDEVLSTVVSNARRNIELAKQRVREAESEAEAMERDRELRDRELRRLQESTSLSDDLIARTSAYLDDEAEEEERLLEEMTKGYVMDDFEFDLQSKSALPRESDSSNVSGRTWESLATSHATSIGGATTLSTLAEDDVLSQINMRPYITPGSPPSSGLPPLPVSSDFPAPFNRTSVSNRAGSIGSLASSTGPGVRARRLSSQTRELMIETNSIASSPLDPPTTLPPPPIPKDDSLVSGPRTNLHPTQRNPSMGSLLEHVNLSQTRTQEDDENELPPLPRPMGKVPSAPDGLDRMHSNTKVVRSRNASVPIQIPDHEPGSPTSWSGGFPDTNGLHGGIPIMPTPTLANFNFAHNGLPSGGMNIFGSNIHSSTALGRPNSMVANAPLLEPCPESFLLRPFWLMRCLYQTLANPHGGYLSEKLFIPRDVWRVKNVKLKALEDKVSNCDLLTAALLKLAKVDSYDADAVLVEMQSFEVVLDQVQGFLSKKLGSDVGVQASMPLFKPASSTPDEPAYVETATNKYLTWGKRIRAKTSGLGTTTPVSSARESSKDNLTINSVPMTSVHGTQVKRNVAELEFSGPNASYMGALARLFDAAQVLEQIAQQVEDPGLKHSSKTHVGLELSTRHAAEFFGFYVCRFALSDVGLMLDKFIKRGSEWVLV